MMIKNSAMKSDFRLLKKTDRFEEGEMNHIKEEDEEYQ